MHEKGGSLATATPFGRKSVKALRAINRKSGPAKRGSQPSGARNDDNKV
jgi:hypothetical protein